jgi:hypothetical protein
MPSETANSVANVLIAADIAYYGAGISHSQTIQRFIREGNLPPAARKMLAQVAGMKKAKAASVVKQALGNFDDKATERTEGPSQPTRVGETVRQPG